MAAVMCSKSISSQGILLILVLCLSLCILSQTHTHPLDPLSSSEHWTVKSILIDASLVCPFDNCTTIVVVEVDEPEKAAVKAWVDGMGLPPRKAFVMTREDKVIRKIIVNLDKHEVESNTVYRGNGGPILNEVDYDGANEVVENYGPYLESIAKRGLNASEVVLLGFGPGWFNVPEEEGRRILKVQPFYGNGTENYYMREITGITAVVDVDTQEILKYTDNDNGIPVPKEEGTQYLMEEQDPPFLPLQVISIEQPHGPGFNVSGHTVQWGNYWRFHLKMDLRGGLIVSMAETFDVENDSWRSVLYQGYISEMFVPYQEPSEEWYFKTFLDAGEYGLGYLAAPLKPFNDCPKYAYFMESVLSTSSGVPAVEPNAICIFERYAGDVAWRHTEGPVTEVKPKVTLVVRFVSTVGNYDYVLDWEFQTDGLIHVSAGLTGILETGSTKATLVKDYVGVDGDVKHGTLISENVLGVFHDHFLTYRLDLDVDGPENSFVESKLTRRNIPPSTGIPRKSYWDVERHIAQTEADARIQLSLTNPSEYAVINSKKTTRLGNPVSYRLVPHGNAATLLDPTDYAQIRAAFVNNQIWVTQYKKDEKWVSGEFASQSHGDDTLAVWSSRNRKIANEDIVLWYNLGFHHIPVQEDYPVLPTLMGSFDLKPTNFFERNPILKARPFTSRDLAFCGKKSTSTP